MSDTSHFRSPEGERLAMGFYERVIAAWPVPVEQRTVDTRLGPTFVLSWGDPAAPPLVLLHGATANSAAWAADAATYARGFRVHAIDLPGEAGRSTPARPPYAGAEWTDWLGDALDALHVDRACFVGLSLGGWLTLRFAAAAPARVERLVAIAPGGVVPVRRGFMLNAIAYRLLPRWGLGRMTRLVFAPQAPPPGAAEAFAFMVRYFVARTDGLPVTPDEELRRVTQPALLIAGDGDRVLDMPATRARLERLLPNLEVELIPGGGHALLGTGPRAMTFLQA